MGKISIYFANNLVNAGRAAGVNYLSGRVRSGQYLSGLLTAPVVASREEALMTDTGSETNDVWLSIDGTNYGESDIHIVGGRIDVKKKNNVVSTALVNRAGKVKERIQEDDYMVKISGNMMMTEAGKFPFEMLKQLNGILSSANSIYVASRYLDVFNITQLSFREADFNQSALAYFNVMPFVLHFDSDMDYNFLIDEN